MPTISVAPALSKPFTLNPGLLYEGKSQVECVVKLITRRDYAALAKLGDEERANALLARSIHKIGKVTDPAIIGECVDLLTLPDFERINQQITDLQGEYADPVKPVGDLVSLRKMMPSTSITSEPFPLNPGVTVNGKVLDSCIVRLMTRGEWKRIEAEPDPILRDELVLGFSIVQLGDETNLTSEHLSALTLNDNERINIALEALRVQYAPDTKSLCPQCGYRF